MLTRTAIKEAARERLRMNRGNAIAGYVVFVLVTAAASSIPCGIGALLIVPALTVGYAAFVSRFYRGEFPDIGSIFTESFRDYGRKLGGILWMWLFTFLWSLLFIIPGIVKAISYSMTPYILANEPEVEATTALQLSIRMTDGQKGKIFAFYLSFLGWELLSVLTCGILELVWVGPYRETAVAGLYQEIRQDALDKGRIFENELHGFRLHY